MDKMKTMNKAARREHYGAIDGLRVFCAIGIVFMHVLHNGGYQLGGFLFERLIPSFTDFVFLFMIISGFAMCCGYYDKVINNTIDYAQFYGKRYAKSWPFFSVLCILDLIIAPGSDAVREVFANLTLGFGFLHKSISVIGVGWFLGLIFVFYLVFPFFCYLLSDVRRAWFAFAVSIAFNVFCADYFEIGRSNIMYSAPFFLAGGMIYLYRESLAKISKKYRWPLIAACAVLAAGYYFTDVPAVVLLLGLFSCILIVAIGIQKENSRKSVVSFLSSISLEIYLSHMVLFRLMEKVGFIRLAGHSAGAYFVVALCIVVGTVVFSVLVGYGLKIAETAIKKRLRA